MIAALKPGGGRTPMLLVLFVLPSLLTAPGLYGEPQGPLRSAVLDPPHQPYYSFPGFDARAGTVEEIRLHTTAYYLNEFRSYYFDPEEEETGAEGRIEDTGRREELIAMDFESAVLETGLSLPLGRNHRIGTVLRIHSYHGGFMDPLIEGFHGLFGFPNAQRHYFSQGNTHISVENDRAVEIELDGPALLLGDIPLYGIWTFAADGKSAWAAAWAVELPAGRGGTPAGNGHVDLGAALLWQRSFSHAWTLHLRQGIVLPGELLSPSAEASPLPSGQSLLSLEWMPAAGWSILAQTRIHTSFLSSDQPYAHPHFLVIDEFELPVTSLQIGFKRRWERWTLQGFFEEDTFTHEGPDIVFSLGLTRHLRDG
jgi:hypothetical protein